MYKCRYLNNKRHEIYSYFIMETIQKSKLLIYFCWIWELLIECFYTAFQNNFNSYNKMNCELMLTYDIPAYMFNVHKNQLSRQTRSRNLTGPKSLPTIWHTYMKLVSKYQISAINSCGEKCDEKYLGKTDRGKTVYPPPVEWGNENSA